MKMDVSGFAGWTVKINAYGANIDEYGVFRAADAAQAAEVKAAVEACFAEDGVKVEKVNTLRTLGKIKRQGRYAGRTPEIKKAYVTLKEDSKTIEFFDGMAQ